MLGWWRGMWQFLRIAHWSKHFCPFFYGVPTWDLTMDSKIGAFYSCISLCCMLEMWAVVQSRGKVSQGALADWDHIYKDRGLSLGYRFPRILPVITLHDWSTCSLHNTKHTRHKTTQIGKRSNQHIIFILSRELNIILSEIFNSMQYKSFEYKLK